MRDGAAEKAFRKRRCEQATHARRPHGLAEYQDAIWIAAERREQRRARRDQELLYAPSLLEDRMFSENPDRGFADPGA